MAMKKLKNAGDSFISFRTAVPGKVTTFLKCPYINQHQHKWNMSLKQIFTKSKVFIKLCDLFLLLKCV